MGELYSKNLFIADVLDAVASLVVIIDPKGKIVHCNRAFQLCTGHSLQEVRGETCWHLLSASPQIEETKQIHSRLLSSHFPLTFKTHLPTVKGRCRHISWSGKALCCHQGEDRLVIMTGTDVTESGQPATKSQQNQALLAAALPHLPFAIFNQNRQLCYTWIHNPHPPFDSEQALGKRDKDLLPLEDARRLTALKRRVLQSAIGAREEVRLTVDGEVRDYDLFVEPIKGLDGAIVGITCTSIDISERKREELGKTRLLEQAGRQGTHLVGLGERLLEAHNSSNEELAGELYEQMRRGLAAFNLSAHLMRSTRASNSVSAAAPDDSVSDTVVGESAAGALDANLASLSPRELEVLQLVVEGRSSAQIAEILHLSPKSIDTYRSRLRRKLGISTMPGLVAFAIQAGLLAPK